MVINNPKTIGAGVEQAKFVIEKFRFWCNRKETSSHRDVVQVLGKS
jgi:hypothetical protein